MNALEAVITREIGVTPDETRGGVKSFRRAVLPRWLPMAAAVAVTAVVVTFIIPRHLETHSTGILRGPSTAERVPLALEPPNVTGEGTLNLGWRPLLGADAYEVHLYRTDLSEVLGTPEGPETTVVIRHSMLPVDVTAGTTLLWRVVALRKGAEIKRSDVGHLRAP